MDIKKFLEEGPYIDYSSPLIQDKAKTLFYGINDELIKAKTAYEYVRDEIAHSFDIQAGIITAKASDVLAHRTGICHAKANLLAALLRLQNIPAGFRFQHLTLADDDSLGYCVHCYNVVFLKNQWIRLDARGNTRGINAQFSLAAPRLAFVSRSNYDEYDWEGIYSKPHSAAMLMLDSANSLQDVMDNIPDYVHEEPDLIV